MITHSFNEDTWQQYLVRGVGLLFFLTVVEFFGFLRPIHFLGEKITQPMMIVGNQVVLGVELPYRVVVNSFAKYQHVQDLEQRYAEAVAQLAEIDRLKAENQELHTLLNDTNQPQVQQKIAPIISYGKPYVSIGKEKGVSEGSMVLISNTLVGRIGQVSDSQSEVVLLSNMNSVPVLVKTEHGVTGAISGDGRRILLREVPIESDLQTGERVMTVGQPGIAPGISVGRITTIEKPSGSPTQQAVIEQLVSFYQSQVVEVRGE